MSIRDRVEIQKDENSTVIVLSDGLGSGVKANILATLTSRIASRLLVQGVPLREVVETVSNTLPVCQVRKVAYSTYSILQIFKDGRGYLIPVSYTHLDVYKRQMLGEGCRLMAVVKADAYGHGAAVVAREALSAGAEWLAVALAQEALELREAGIGAPILILGYTPAEECPEIIAAGGIRPAIYTLEQARALSAAAAAADARAPYHLKIDSGMSRIGFRPGEEALEEIRRIRELPNLLLEGCFTHFARADENDKSSRDQQFALFIDFADRLRQEGEIPIVHCANTAAAMDFPAGRLDMIRLGIGLYGLYP